MKRIFIAFTLIFALSTSVNAQEKKIAEATKEVVKVKTPAEIEELSYNDAKELIKLIGLPEEQKTMFARVFMRKYDVQNSDLPKHKKDEVLNSIEAKIRASLTPEQTQKLEKNIAQFQKLINK